jgi:hypothetical protein
MTILHHIYFDDLSLQAINQFSKVEVYFTITVFKRSIVYTVFEILQEFTKGLHGLTVLLSIVKVGDR